MIAVRLSAFGGAEQLAPAEQPLPEPGPGQVRLRVAWAGVNFIDVYQRTGLYPVALPATLGLEAAGVIEAVGPGVDPALGLHPGQPAASVRCLGAYAEYGLAPAAHTVPVPDAIGLRTAAAVLLQGLTAHYLVASTFPLGPGHTCVIHAAAGGVGLLLVQMARARGAQVLATVGDPAKAALAEAAGAHQVVPTGSDFAAAARALTAGAGADVVYDAVGAATWERSLAALRPRGMMVSFGNASGPVPAVAPLVLSQHGSLFLTRPTLAHYTATTAELRQRVGDLFGAVAAGRLAVRVGLTLPLAAAAEAHRALESRQTTGKVLLAAGPEV